MKTLTSMIVFAILVSFGCGGEDAEPTAYDLLRETEVKVNGEYVDAAHLTDKEREMVQKLIKENEGEFEEEIRTMELELDRYDADERWRRNQ